MYIVHCLMCAWTTSCIGLSEHPSRSLHKLIILTEENIARNNETISYRILKQRYYSSDIVVNTCAHAANTLYFLLTLLSRKCLTMQGHLLGLTLKLVRLTGGPGVVSSRVSVCMSPPLSVPMAMHACRWSGASRSGR